MGYYSELAIEQQNKIKQQELMGKSSVGTGIPQFIIKMKIPDMKEWNGHPLTISAKQQFVDDVIKLMEEQGEMKQDDGEFVVYKFTGDTLVLGNKDYGGTEIILAKVTHRTSSYDVWPKKEDED